MTKAMEPEMYIGKAEIIATLRSKGLHARAAWVERELSDPVDAHRNSALLQMLDIDPTTMTSVDVDQQPAVAPASGRR